MEFISRTEELAMEYGIEQNQGTSRQGSEANRENAGKHKPILTTTGNNIEPGHIKHLQHEQQMHVNGCFCRLGEAGQLFSGDSEMQWTTAVLTANVRFLLLMLAGRVYNRAFIFPNL